MMNPSGTALIGEDPKLRAALRLVERVAPTPATVLIVGETGTGKELVARLLHQRSARAARTFLSPRAGSAPVRSPPSGRGSSASPPRSLRSGRRSVAPATRIPSRRVQAGAGGCTGPACVRRGWSLAARRGSLVRRPAPRPRGGPRAASRARATAPQARESMRPCRRR
ncbi:MAG: sigma 54-interacting transcriptional regulator [Gemmatimonadaceae bacterium]|nr:sigma 54-interacting transcriptional regulator [Gemmatimonadaceae bacterium]